MKRIEQITATIFLLLAAVVVVSTRDLAYWEDISPGNRFMPLWVAGASAVLALLLLLEAGRRTNAGDVDWPDRGGAFRVISTLLGIVVFALLADVIGLLAATALFIIAVLVGVLRRPLLPSALATAITVTLIYGVFVSWLSLPLPKGVFGL